MTPREFFALLRVHRWREDREYYRMAKICEVMAGVMGAKNKKTNEPFTAQDFMPTDRGAEPVNDVAAKALAFAAAFGFEVKPGAGEEAT